MMLAKAWTSELVQNVTQADGGNRPHHNDASRSVRRYELCTLCKHNSDPCFVACNFHKAPPGWKPSQEVRAKASLPYMQKQQAPAQAAGAALGGAKTRARRADECADAQPQVQQQQVPCWLECHGTWGWCFAGQQQCRCSGSALTRQCATAAR